MTDGVTGRTGKTGFFSFLACKNQRNKYCYNKRKNIESGNYPVFSVFAVHRLCLADMEKDIVVAILRYLKTLPRCFAWKTHGGMYGTAGIPDIIACIDGGFYAFEVKQPGGRITRLQEVTLEKLRAAGSVAVMVTSVDEVKCALAGKGAVL